MTELISDLAQLKLCLQSALINRVTRNLRAVSFNLEKDCGEIVFYYDGSVEEALANQAIQEAILCFQQVNKEAIINSYIRQVDYPKKMVLNGYWVFYRAEDSSKYVD